ncbi:MAG TPA: NAD(P)/FAD-dependent oxidoreductase [Thermoanaerobaculia bacterium]|jgi:protoporphyrinogen oxidase|nr:NAD(P)/FAD-dependent oxidoreductase [Thermoanaerobaculia bacterium]
MREDPSEDPAVVIGAGPGGLTAAWELARQGLPAAVVEQDEAVGGLARTVTYKGYRFDIGGHRFFTKVDLVREIWEEILGEDFLERPRLSRIFYGDKFFAYPLKPFEALRGLGLLETLRIGASYLRAQLDPSPEERNFEQWVSNRFGRRLYEIFFKTYTEKVWGIPCTEIEAEWAAQRIKNLDLKAAVKNALLGSRARGGEVITTLIDRFHYPRLGPGMMWERLRDRLEEKGVPTWTGLRVTGIRHERGRVESVATRDRQGRERIIPATHVLSTMPIRELIHALDPPPPPEIAAAADRLRYRDFLTVVLIVDRAEVFPDNWIYVHSPKVKVGRVQNFKSWSPEMVPDPSKTSLGLEYFVQENDELWSSSDADLAALGAREMAALGLIREEEVIDSTVVRMPKAYPVYDGSYHEALAALRGYLSGLSNLQLIGRNGQHHYNNQDHSMLTGIYAARNAAGASYDVWSVNVEQEYHEEVSKPAVTGRAVPGRAAEAGLDEILAAAFARYEPVALGAAVGTVAGTGIFLATALLLLQGGDPPGPMLSLLGNYFFGYQVSWGGGLVGLVEAASGGFGFGYLLARMINGLVGWVETSLWRQLQMAHTLDPLEGGAS